MSLRLRLVLIFVAFAMCATSLFWPLKRNPTAPTDVVASSEPAPLTGWAKFYAALQDDSVALCVGVSCDASNKEVMIFFVDDDRWYHLSTLILKGCGPEHETYYCMVGLAELKRELKCPPSAHSKIVVVGPGGPVLHKIEFLYRGEQ